MEQEERKEENGLSVFVEIMEGLPSAARNIVTEEVLLRQGCAGWWRRRELKAVEVSTPCAEVHKH